MVGFLASHNSVQTFLDFSRKKKCLLIFFGFDLTHLLLKQNKKLKMMNKHLNEIIKKKNQLSSNPISKLFDLIKKNEEKEIHLNV
jgi:hypothetical protein